MKYLLLICADEDAEAADPGEPAWAGGLERADLGLDEADEPPRVRFGSVDVRPVRRARPLRAGAPTMSAEMAVTTSGAGTTGAAKR